jgi:branched-chain amino acid transport system permease protein
MTLPAGVYSETYAQDQALIKTYKQWCWLLGLLFFLFILPFIAEVGIVGIMIVTCIMIIPVVGLQITTGYAGQINLGQSAMMGIGAYVCAATSVNASLPACITIPIGGISAAIFAAVFGLSAVRIKGFYMALTTFAAHYIFNFTMLKLPRNWFGQSEGIRIQFASIGPFVFDTDIKMYYLILGITIIMTYGAFSLMRGKAGRALVAVRDNENAADIVGINSRYYKVLAFFIGGFYAGIGGSLWAYYIRYIMVEQFTIWYSVWFLAMLIVGGMGSILGAIIGTLIIRFSQELITYLGPQLAVLFPQIGGQIVFASMNLLLGGSIMIFVIFQPRGLVYRWNILKEAFRIWPFPH